MPKYIVFCEAGDLSVALRLSKDDGFRCQQLGSGLAAFHTPSAGEATRLNGKFLSNAIQSVTSFDWNLYRVTGSVSALQLTPKLSYLLWPTPGNENSHIFAAWCLPLADVCNMAPNSELLLEHANLADILTLCVIPLSSIGKGHFMPFREALMNTQDESKIEGDDLECSAAITSKTFQNEIPAAQPARVRYTPEQLLLVRSQMKESGLLKVRAIPESVLSTRPRNPLPPLQPSNNFQKPVEVPPSMPLHVPLPTRSQGLPAILETLLAAYRQPQRPPPPLHCRPRGPPMKSEPIMRIAPREIRQEQPPTAWNDEQRLFELLSIAQKVVAGQVGSIKSPTRTTPLQSGTSPFSRSIGPAQSCDSVHSRSRILQSLNIASPSKEVVETVAQAAFKQACLRVSKSTQSLNPSAPEFMPRTSEASKAQLLQLLVDAGPDGIEVDLIPQLFSHRYTSRLFPGDFGASDLKGVLGSMWPDVVVFQEMRKPQSLKPELEVIRRALQLPQEQETSVARAMSTWTPPANRLLQQLLIALVSDLIVAEVGLKPSTLLTGVSLTRIPYEWRKKYASQYDLHALLLSSGSANLLHFCSSANGVFDLLRSGGDLLIRVKTPEGSLPSFPITNKVPQEPDEVRATNLQSITKTMLHRMIFDVVAAGCARQASGWDRDMDLSEMHAKRVAEESMDATEKAKRKKEEKRRRQLAFGSSDIRSCLEKELFASDDTQELISPDDRQFYRNETIGILVSSVKAEWARKWRAFQPLDVYLFQFGIRKVKVLLLEVPELVVLGSEGSTRVSTIIHAERYCSPVPSRFPVGDVVVKSDFSPEKVQQLLYKLIDQICEEQSAMFRLGQAEGRLSTLTTIAARCFGGESVRTSHLSNPREFDECVAANGIFGVKLVDIPMAWWLLYRSALHDVLLGLGGHFSIEDLIGACPNLTVIGSGDTRRCVTCRHPPNVVQDQRLILDSALQSMQQTAAAHEAAMAALTSALAAVDDRVACGQSNWVNKPQVTNKPETLEPSTAGTSAVCHEG